MDSSFKPVWLHRLKYLLSPQMDLYRNISDKFAAESVLDYGCGCGFGLLPFAPLSPDRTLCGVDKDHHAVLFANEMLGKIGWFHESDWSDGWRTIEQRFDLVMCIEVIEHVATPEALLDALIESVSPGGTLIISTLNHNSQYRKNNDHVGRFTVQTFMEFLCTKMLGVKICDFQFSQELGIDSSITPMVAVWNKPFIDGSMGVETEKSEESSR